MSRLARVLNKAYKSDGCDLNRDFIGRKRFFRVSARSEILPRE
jgi:hypothetical protein